MASRHKSRREDSEALDALLEEILTDAYGDGEQLSALHLAFEERVASRS